MCVCVCVCECASVCTAACNITRLDELSDCLIEFKNHQYV